MTRIFHRQIRLKLVISISSADLWQCQLRGALPNAPQPLRQLGQISPDSSAPLRMPVAGRTCQVGGRAYAVHRQLRPSVARRDSVGVAAGADRGDGEATSSLGRRLPTRGPPFDAAGKDAAGFAFVSRVGESHSKPPAFLRGDGEAGADDQFR
ncbi:hypothetical protein HPB47_000710 [Ixodes persulcatus]|uniref:Uncharacterized protein n=1 Tax=Ixodes persulcatus TaxID=34615 RepID=A0AC60PRS3_IXOPE|nr:hypothetical protein HPB47_000710 [Ixodes persulcatus]